jgi:hypothetical protein
MVDPEGKNGGPVVDNSETPPYTWTTYPERLQAAGVTWRNYQEPDTGDDNPLAWFKQYQTAPASSPLFKYGMATVPPGALVEAFAEDVRNDNLNLERRREVSFPGLPHNYLLNQYVNSQDQNNPVVPTTQTLPTQEPGSRPHT